MSMFSKLKEVNDLRNQAKKLQGELAAITVEKTHKGVTVTATADMRISNIAMEGNPSGDDIRDAVNAAITEAQSVAASHMRATGGL